MAKKKYAKRGRPATGHDPIRSFRMSKSLLAAVEKWQQNNIAHPNLTISDAVRSLLIRGLLAEGTIKEYDPLCLAS